MLRQLARRWTGRILRFSGSPPSWAQACRQSGGYSQQHILDRVAGATRNVLAGQASYERDAVLFTQPDYPYALLSALLRAAALNGGKLHVVDFGGSLGSTYRQCRPLLEGLSEVRWRVIEQAAFVAVGRQEFSTDSLSFHATLEELNDVPTQGVVLASSVLQYLESPRTTLVELTQMPAGHLVIDRTPMSEARADRLCIQHVPKHIYDASYPCWILSRSLLLEQLAPQWRVLADFPCEDGSFATDDGLQFEFRGLILERRA